MNSPALILGLLIACALFYYSAFVLYLMKKRKLSDVFSVAGFAVNLLLIVNNFIINSYVPFVSMFQVLIFLAACFCPLGRIIEHIGKRKGFIQFFYIASAIVITGPVFMNKNALWTFPPALRSPWFVPHILVYMISYSLAAVAFIITVYLMIGKQSDESIVYYIVRILFPFMTCGMFFGAMWANEVWGQFWAFDIKECWSLVTWLTYMLYLHFYRKSSLRKYCKFLSIAGFIALVITFLFANVIGGSSMHSYS